MDVERIESEAADLEANVEQLEAGAEETDRQVEAIDKTIERVSGDIAVVQALGENRQAAENAEREIQERRTELVDELSSLSSQLESQFQTLEADRAVLADLASIGEDVSESMAILDEKQVWLESCQEQLHELGNRLDVALEAYDLGDWTISDAPESVEQGSASPEQAGAGEAEGSHGVIGHGDAAAPDVSSDYDVDNGLVTDGIPTQGSGASGAGSGSPEAGAGGKTPYEALWAYMASHNYGKDDYEVYSKDPEWEKLHKAAFPDYHHVTDHQLLHEEKLEWIKGVVPHLAEGEAERIVDSLDSYFANGYESIHWDSKAELQETQGILRVFDSGNVPAYKGRIFRGLSFDSKRDLFNALTRDPGSWSEPGISSFSTDFSVAKSFAQQRKWGIVFTCDNNKTGISVRHMSALTWESEVLSPGGLRNNGWTVDVSSMRVDEAQHLVFANIEEK